MNKFPSQVQNAINKGYDLRIGEYVSSGFRIVQNNLGLFIGFILLYFFIQAAGQIIPVVGPIGISLVLTPCLTAGFYLAAKKSDHQEPLQFDDFFKGFDFIGNLVLMTLLQAVLIIASLIPMMIAFFATVGIDIFSDGELNNFPFWIFILVIPAIYLTISWAFAPLLVVFHKMEAWPALEASRQIISKNWFVYLAFSIVTGFLAMAGAFALLIGLLFTVPAAMAMTYAAFKDVVGLPNQQETDINDHFLVD